MSAIETKLIVGLKQVSTQIATKLPKLPISELNKQNLENFSRRVLDSPWLDPKNPVYRSRKFLIGAGLGVGVGGSALAVGVTLWSIERSLPDPNEVFTFVRDGTLTIKAADNSILQQIGPATREKLKLDEMPPQLVQAFIASEDSRFYQHKGVDYQGIGRAFVSNLMRRDVVEGGSTITQQLARLVFLTQERSVGRKVQEVFLAQKIEQKMNKDQILDRYLNLVYLGEGAYGVADAAWVYFSKPLKDLTLPEIATIAGVTPAPSIYSPLVNPQAAQQRRNTVLQRMQQVGYITPDQAQTASAQPLALNPAPPKRLSTEAEYFTSYIQKELAKYVSPDAIEAGGLIVETTLDRQWQKNAEQSVQDVLKRYGSEQKFGQAALVSIDPRNGEVKAMVGGTDFEKTQFNRVTQAQRQPGSTFKGFLYTTAVAAGFSPYRGYLDAPLSIDGYTPKNYGGGYFGWISMRDALATSINTVAVKVLLDVGFQPTIDIAHKMGIKSELKPTYSLALGASELNLLELTNGYGTLATGGVYAESHGIRRVLDQRGKVLYQANFKPQQAIDTETASIMNWMLREVVNGGTGRAAYLNDRPVAGKTGTSDEARDLWFIGYIPQAVTGVWLGNDDNSPTVGSSSTAAMTWHNFMVKAVDGMPVEKFAERPQKLEGRKATIAIQPIEPGKIYSGKIARKVEKEEPPAPQKIIVSKQDRDEKPVTRSVRSQDDSDTPTPQRRRRRYSQVTETKYISDSSPAPRRVRSERLRRRSYTADTNSAPTQPVRQSRRRSYTADTNSAPTQPVRQSRRRYYTANTNSAPAQPVRQSRRRYYSANANSAPAQPVRQSRRRYYSANANSAPAQPVRQSRRRYYTANTNSAPAQPVRQSRRRYYTADTNAAPATYRAERSRRRTVQQYTAQSEAPRRRTVRQYTAQSQAPRRRTEQYSNKSEPRRRTVQQYNAVSETPRRRTVRQYSAQSESSRRTRRYSTPSYTAAAPVRSRSERRRVQRASSASRSIQRQAPTLARPLPAAAPPTIELNTHR
ncbi:PBP1A family penicillin-binding protein [Planktothrix sp. FACHB-1375]|uniref:PBP1A family penicillin-binding protein n=1 Tax=Aerosakkonema funiforme FACHB-1375 TaxID=2949571 RepID=A0A926VIA1_9CYAN|nr:PBP1A family penicillin-binding protein [Aerosakkonema funiforme FACHB-1375]